jgi:hypothetical protein
MSTGKAQAAAILRGPDGEELYLRLVRYTEWLARVHGWKEGRILPGGASPRSIAHEMVSRLLDPEGLRTWDGKKEPSLLNALKGMVRSEIGHLYQKLEESAVQPINIPLPGGDERTGDSFPSTALRPDELNPEEQLLRQEKDKLQSAAMTLILKEVEGNGDLESVALALYDADNLSDIAAETGLSIERVYSVRRELERIARKIPVARVIRAAQQGRKS